MMSAQKAMPELQLLWKFFTCGLGQLLWKAAGSSSGMGRAAAWSEPNGLS